MLNIELSKTTSIPSLKCHVECITLFTPLCLWPLHTASAPLFQFWKYFPQNVYLELMVAIRIHWMQLQDLNTGIHLLKHLLNYILRHFPYMPTSIFMFFSSLAATLFFIKIEPLSQSATIEPVSTASLLSLFRIFPLNLDRWTMVLFPCVMSGQGSSKSKSINGGFISL